MKLGRLSVDEMEKVIEDAPEQMVKAVLTKQDEILTKLNAILVAIETATDSATLYTELDGMDKAILKEVELYK